MTALAGIWNFSGRDTARDCARMLQAQSLYGKRPPSSWCESGICLGRQIFETLPEDRLDAGPLVAPERKRVLIGDVRLDNRGELADALGLTGRQAQMSDSALLMAALDRWDEEAIDRLVGDFAFVLWDGGRERLLLARDYLGQRPLHYHRGKEFFAFASMPKGLHALAEVPRAPDREAVAAFVALIPETGTETFFEGIEKVRPGHLVTVTREGVSARPYWRPPTASLQLNDPREYEEAVRAELDRAVECRLRGAGEKVGAHLSGGLDSSAVAATAARELAGRGLIVAYTAVPREGYSGGLRNSITDEGPLAAAVAALYPNIEHVKVAASGSSPLDPLDLYFHAFERPFLNLCNGVWATAILEDARARGLSVMLTGQAGNMSFSYDGMAALSQMLGEGRWIALARTAASLVRRGARIGTVGAQIVGPLLPKQVWAAISRARGKGRHVTDYTAINPALVPGLARTAADRGLDFSYRPRSDPHSLRTWVLERVDVGNYNKGQLGGWGIDVRDPTADRRLVELCLSIPAEQFVAGGVPRSLARRAFADRLPEAVCRERKKGYQAADWHEALTKARSQVGEEVERSANVPLACEILSIPTMGELVRNWPGGGWNEVGLTEKYRLALLRGTSAAHFIRKASGSNA